MTSSNKRVYSYQEFISQSNRKFIIDGLGNCLAYARFSICEIDLRLYSDGSRTVEEEECSSKKAGFLQKQNANRIGSLYLRNKG